MLRFSANISTLFTEWPMADRFAAAADAGFAAVEIQFPYEIPADRLASARAAAGVEVVLINIPAGDMAKGEVGLACLPGRRRDFRDAVARGADYCAALACPRINCLSGAPGPADDRDEAWATLVDNVGWAAGALAASGVGLLVEALNRVDRPAFMLNALSATDRLLREVAHPNLGLQFDLYHARANGEAWRTALATRLPTIGHIQYSDYPGRVEPGAGELDFAAFFDTVARSAYDGWTGCEYTPTGGTLASLAWRDRLGVR